MNKNTGFLLAASASLLFLPGSKLSQPIAQEAKQRRHKSTRVTQRITPITGYKRWTRATQRPVLEFSRFAMLCAGPTTQQVEQEKTNPHNDKYIVVYVNETGKHALLREERPTYPVGTIIVKEKRTKPNSTTPELCTVMRKREAGYNPQGGNWEYFVTNGTGTRLQNIGDAANCKSCHAQQKPVDYVFRRYLPKIAYRYTTH